MLQPMSKVLNRWYILASQDTSCHPANVNDEVEDSPWQQYKSRFRTFEKLILKEPEVPLSMIICIPSYAEPDLINTLESLSSCSYPGILMEVLILFNQDDRMTESERSLHRQSFDFCSEWIKERNHLHFSIYPIWLEKMEGVKWGVGWARKRLMDEAARRLIPEGIIVSLDADCTVSENYVECIWNEFQSNPSFDAASLYVEHHLEHLSQRDRQAITEYELHLRYLVHAKRWTGHPFAFQTFGSAMAVRRKAYLEQGGMNTRQAGEDFYFLQKFIELGKLKEITGATVFPSSRKSLRVPFGTGKAIYQINEEMLEWKTTAFEVYELIRPLFQEIPILHQVMNKQNDVGFRDKVYSRLNLSTELVAFLEHIDFISHCDSISLHTSNYMAFERRFYRFFNAFMMIRYMHYMRDQFIPDVPVSVAVEKLVDANESQQPAQRNAEQYLQLFRKWDKSAKAFS